MSYKDDLKVNRYILDDLWEVHQDIYMEYAEEHAEAIKSRNDAKELLDFKKAQAKDALALVQSQLDNEVRSNPNKYGYERLTEQIVSSWIVRQLEYQEALANLRKIIHEYTLELNKEEYKVDLLKGVKESFEHRKASMDNLTRLMLGGYYSGKPAKDIRESVMERKEQRQEETTQEKLKQSFRRRRELNG